MVLKLFIEVIILLKKTRKKDINKAIITQHLRNPLSLSSNIDFLNIPKKIQKQIRDEIINKNIPISSNIDFSVPNQLPTNTIKS